MKKNKTSLPVKPAALSIIIIIVFFIAARYLGATLKKSDYFMIKNIFVNKPQEAFDFSYLSGRNIFDIDLKKESRYISEQYPVYKKVGLFRILPDRLFIAFVDREPLACVKLYRDFYVDSDRVLFDSPQGLVRGEFPVINGLERKIIGPKPGKQYNIKELTAALNIIKEARTNKLLGKYKFEKIDLSSPANISCFIRPLENYGYQVSIASKAIEVKMGQDDIPENVRVLAGLLAQFGNDINNVNYIDLRFKEPVVKLNKDKNLTNATRGAY